MSKEAKVEVLPHLDSKCENCRWYLGDRQCPAFELNIPEIIWKGEHNTVLEEQVVDLTFESNGPIL